MVMPTSQAICQHSRLTTQRLVQVAVRPTLAPLTVDAVPANLAPHVNLSSSLVGEDWNAIWEEICNNANYRYAVVLQLLEYRSAFSGIWTLE